MYLPLIISSIALFCSLGSAVAKPSSTATALVVGPSRTYTTLQAAVDAAVDGDLIELEPGTWQGASIDKDLTIVGLGGPDLVTIEAPVETTVLLISGATVQLSEVGVAPAMLGHGVVAYNSEVSVSGCIFKDGDAIAGPALVAQDSTITLDKNTFINNRSITDGGHISIEYSTLVSRDNVYEGGRAGELGGAINVYEGEFTSEGDLFFNNRADLGGAINARDLDSELRISNAHFEGNTSTTGGGCIAYFEANDTRIESSTFVSNDGGGQSGVLQYEGRNALATVRVVGNRVQSNEGSIVGAIGLLFKELDEGEFIIEQNLFCGNSQPYGGGVIYSGWGHGRIENNLFVNNTASAGTSAIDLWYPSGANIVQNSFVGNNHPSSCEFGAVQIHTGQGTLLGNVFAYNGGCGFANDGLVGPKQGNLYYDNNDAIDGLLAPGFADFTDDGDCDNDQLWAGSNTAGLIDFYTNGEADADGSPADAGAFGGPNGRPHTFYDFDEDGVGEDTDCDDTNINAQQGLLGANELCDGLDNDCDGEIDEGFSAPDLTTFYIDTDHDGFGDPGEQIAACVAPEGFVANDQDCDDTDVLIAPDRVEIAGDGVDQDCDGEDSQAVETTEPSSTTTPSSPTTETERPVFEGPSSGDAAAEPEKSGGCSVAPGGAGVWGALLLLLARRRSKNTL